jgi:hypothetical protein
VSQQDGFGNNRTQPPGRTSRDDDGMQKKSENVAHALDAIKRKKLRIHGLRGIRHPTRPQSSNLKKHPELIELKLYTVK